MPGARVCLVQSSRQRRDVYGLIQIALQDLRRPLHDANRRRDFIRLASPAGAESLHFRIVRRRKK